MTFDLRHGVDRTRGTALLLFHCALLDRLTAPAAWPAEERLCRTLGSELAQRLVRVLARGQALDLRSVRGG